MRISLVLILLLSFQVNASDIPLSWLKVNPSQNLTATGEEKLNSILNSHKVFLDRLGTRYPNLDRFDLSLGVNKSGGLGIFSYGKSSTMELIWKRQAVPLDETVNVEINLTPYSGEKEIADDLVANLREVLDFKLIRGKVRRRIIKTLYQDASKINRFVQTLYHTPQIGQWYVHSFWRNYYFSTSYGILDNLNLGYSKRVRFRFKLNRTPYVLNSTEQKADNRILTGLLSTFNQVTAMENQEDDFDFYRVWASFDINVGFNLLIFSKSVGKGFLVDMRKNNAYTSDQQFSSNFSAKAVSHITNKINGFISNRLDDREQIMQLDQVRYMFGISKELDLSLVTVEKAADLNFQFRRKRATIIENKIGAPIARAMKSLNQIDYRHRASFSFGLPFINRIRLRPSYEYRYRVR